jgi:hypothetical protein
MTATYWEIGRRIVEFEQRGTERAAYGEALIERLSEDLTRRFGRGFSRQNLGQMRAFYRAWPAERICQAVSGESLPPDIIANSTHLNGHQSVSAAGDVCSAEHGAADGPIGTRPRLFRDERFCDVVPFPTHRRTGAFSTQTGRARFPDSGRSESG